MYEGALAKSTIRYIPRCISIYLSYTIRYRDQRFVWVRSPLKRPTPSSKLGQQSSDSNTLNRQYPLASHSPVPTGVNRNTQRDRER